MHSEEHWDCVSMVYWPLKGHLDHKMYTFVTVARACAIFKHKMLGFCLLGVPSFTKFLFALKFINVFPWLLHA